MGYDLIKMYLDLASNYNSRLSKIHLKEDFHFYLLFF